MLHIFTYGELKRSLLTEFESKVSTEHIHDLLRSSKCRSSETALQLFLTMSDRENRIVLDAAYLIHYVITRFNDTPKIKSKLYGAANLAEFKSKFYIYEEML